MISRRVANPEDLPVYRRYIREIKKFPLLSKEEEIILFQKIKKKDRKAFNRVVCSNLRFVIKIALLYRGQGLSLNDLINEGNLGLMEAVKRFDLQKKVKFTSYAVWWIRHAIVQAIFEKARLVRISAQKELLLRRINKHASEGHYVAEGGHTIDARALSRKLGYSWEQMEKVLEMGQRHSSLYSPFSNDSNDLLVDRLQDTDIEYPDESLDRRSFRNYLDKFLNSLKSMERKVIVLFFGLESNKVLNLREISEVMGISKERVRQIKESALDKLRQTKFRMDYLQAA
jgi:RNA polymerase primary sigma factor